MFAFAIPITHLSLYTSLRYADACLFFCACTNGNSNLRQQRVLSSSPYPCTFVIRMFHTSLRYACVDVFTNFWSVVYIFSSKKTTYHFGGAHDDRLLLAIHASCQDWVRTLPPISKRFCIVRVILHTSLRYALTICVCVCARGSPGHVIFGAFDIITFDTTTLRV